MVPNFFGCGLERVDFPTEEQFPRFVTALPR